MIFVIKNVANSPPPPSPPKKKGGTGINQQIIPIGFSEQI